uniref:Uncharacterized protein n=1 Tax=Rhizophora mucronata TaxID=61149 RepID=A0A2P2Q2J5_RHIMU
MQLPYWVHTASPFSKPVLSLLCFYFLSLETVYRKALLEVLIRFSDNFPHMDRNKCTVCIFYGRCTTWL